MSETTKTKPGWKTTEFWLTLVSQVAPHVIPGLPATWAVAANIVSVVAYNLSRGLAKR
jgi:hypothetical protein